MDGFIYYRVSHKFNNIGDNLKTAKQKLLFTELDRYFIFGVKSFEQNYLDPFFLAKQKKL